MFPDASETTDFDSSKQMETNGATNSRDSGTPREIPYFFGSLFKKPKIENTVDDALSRFKYYSKIKNFIRRDDTCPVNNYHYYHHYQTHMKNK